MAEAEVIHVTDEETLERTLDVSLKTFEFAKATGLTVSQIRSVLVWAQTLTGQEIDILKATAKPLSRKVPFLR